MSPAIKFIYESILGHSMRVSQPFWAPPIARYLTGRHVFYFEGTSEFCKAILTPTKQKVIVDWGMGDFTVE